MSSDVMKWAELCKWLYALGHMPDFSKGECLKVNKQLKKLIAEGKVERTARGRYRLISVNEQVPEDDELVA